MRLAGVVVLAVLLGPGQDKPAAAFKQIVDCVRAGACPNMTPAKIHWYDVVNIPVLTFTDDGWTYAVRLDPPGPTGRPEALALFLTPPAEPRPTQTVSLNLEGELVKGSLGPQPGERVPVDPRTYPGGLAGLLSARKVYAATGWYPSGEIIGAEFRPMWQKLADQAIAAASRAVAGRQATPPAPYEEIFACAKAMTCRNMTITPMRFSDAVGDAVGFTIDGTMYQLHVSNFGLEIIITLPGETAPSRLVSVGPKEQVIIGELRGDGARATRRTPEEQANWERDRKRYSNGEQTPVKGAEFKGFWQEQATTAMAAIRKQIAK